MAKKKPVPAPAPAQATQPKTPRLNWPANPKETAESPRLFRLHRLSTYEWQAFATDNGKEMPIGKPDTFDLVMRRIAQVLREEGQKSFMAAKKQPDPVNVQVQP